MVGVGNGSRCTDEGVHEIIEVVGDIRKGEIPFPMVVHCVVPYWCATLYV